MKIESVISVSILEDTSIKGLQSRIQDIISENKNNDYATRVGNLCYSNYGETEYITDMVETIECVEL